MDFSLLLAIVATVVQLTAFWLYNRQMFRGLQEPNTTTWSLWALLTILNSSSYTLASRDLVKGLLSIATSAACLGTCIYALKNGKFKRPKNMTDYVVLVIGLIAIVLWKLYHSAAVGNITVQLAVMISFVPTFRDAYRARKKEDSRPWFIWSGAYVLLLGVVVLRWQGKPWDLVYPIVGIVFHLIVAVLSFNRNSYLERR